jgi:hypothetical protein
MRYKLAQHQSRKYQIGTLLMLASFLFANGEIVPMLLKSNKAASYLESPPS